MVNDGASKLHWLTTQMSWWTCFCWKDRKVIILHQHRLQIACLDSKEISLYVMLQLSLSLRVGLIALERDSLGSCNGARCRKFASQQWSEFGSSIYNTTISSNKKNKWTFEILTSLRTSFWQNSSQPKISVLVWMKGGTWNSGPGFASRALPEALTGFTSGTSCRDLDPWNHGLLMLPCTSLKMNGWVPCPHGGLVQIMFLSKWAMWCDL